MIRPYSKFQNVLRLQHQMEAVLLSATQEDVGRMAHEDTRVSPPQRRHYSNHWLRYHRQPYNRDSCTIQSLIRPALLVTAAITAALLLSPLHCSTLAGPPPPPPCNGGVIEIQEDPTVTIIIPYIHYSRVGGGTYPPNITLNPKW